MSIADKDWKFPLMPLFRFAKMVKDGKQRSQNHTLRGISNLSANYYRQELVLENEWQQIFKLPRGPEATEQLSNYAHKKKSFLEQGQDGEFLNDIYVAQLLTLTTEQLSHVPQLGKIGVARIVKLCEQHGFELGEFGKYRQELKVQQPQTGLNLFLPITTETITGVFNKISASHMGIIIDAQLAKSSRITSDFQQGRGSITIDFSLFPHEEDLEEIIIKAVKDSIHAAIPRLFPS